MRPSAMERNYMKSGSNNLNELKNRFPSALYSFFQIKDIDIAEDSFFEGKNSYPAIGIPQRLLDFDVDSYLESLSRLANSDQLKNDEAKFINRRLKEACILKEFISLQNKEKITTKDINNYRRLMIELYGDFNKNEFYGVLQFVLGFFNKKNVKPPAEISEILENHRKAKIFSPKEKVFIHYRKLAKSIIPEMFNEIEDYEKRNTLDIIKGALKESGLLEYGWKVKWAKTGANIVVANQKKHIYVGSHFKPTSKFRMKQLIAHEVYGHARRYELGNVDTGNFEEEGVAILLEQLLAKRFIYKRMIRYLTACFSWGVDGKPRNFIETYTIMLPIVKIITGNNDKDSEKKCFQECIRVFRGGLPAEKGAIFPKDKIYLESNMYVWEKLSDNLLNKEDFASLLEKRSTIYSEEN